MITRSATTLDSLSWQEELNASIRSPRELLQLLQIDPSLLDNAQAASADFPLRVPRPYLERIEKGNPNDPLLRQILPLGDELLASPGYTNDPVGDVDCNVMPGLIHKYHGRVLLVVSPNCAINCRYCFRRHFAYQDNKPARQDWQRALDYIQKDNTITEVIYSGGDPLASSDRQLLWLTEKIADIPHVQRLRVHTRLPVVIPNRITRQCLDWLTGTRLKPVVVIHSNHANELDKNVTTAMSRLTGAGITLLNQAVLLKGINDCPHTQALLSERLFEIGVLPYYLHLLDKVSGAAHFEVTEADAIQLHQQLLAILPGYLTPKLVRELPGEANKSPIL